MLDIIAGSVANVVSCGEYSFANMTSSEACDAYEKIKSTGCTPKLEGDFQSVNYEVQHRPFSSLIL